MRSFLLVTLAFILSACTSHNYKKTIPTTKTVSAVSAKPLTRVMHGMPPINKIPRGSTTIQSSWNSFPVSPGDTFRIDITDGEQFSGIYQVGFDGYLQLPFIKPIKAQGKSIHSLEKRIKRSLIQQDIATEGVTDVSVRIKQWAPVNVRVRGAVALPGEVTINNRDSKDKTFETTASTGDNAKKRFLSYALKAAAGVTPYADMHNIIVKRQNRMRRYDLSGIFTGHTVQDVPLIQGDEVIVPTLNILQKQYVRPSRVTPPGIKIIVTNLTTPVQSKAVDNIHVSLPYGSNLIHAAQIGACTGGNISNKNRKITLIRKDLRTGIIYQPIEQTIHHLFSHLNSATFNPVLSAQDSVVCYDSNVTNLREIFKLFTDILTPIVLGKTL